MCVCSDTEIVCVCTDSESMCMCADSENVRVRGRGCCLSLPGHPWGYLPAPVCCQEAHKLLVPVH